jgi:hypothetical protein
MIVAAPHQKSKGVFVCRASLFHFERIRVNGRGAVLSAAADREFSLASIARAAEKKSRRFRWWPNTSCRSANGRDFAMNQT